MGQYMKDSKSNIYDSLISGAGFSVRYDEPRWWLRNSSTILRMQLFLFCFTMAIIHFSLKRFGVSRFSCQLITGLIFGCSWKHWDVAKNGLFTVDSEDVLGLFAYFGYTLFLFLSTVKLDVIMILKTDRKALKIGIPVLLVPLIAGFVVQAKFQRCLTTTEINLIPLMLSFHCMTSFPVIASLLHELQMVNSKVGRLGLSSALIIDMLSLIFMISTGQARRFVEDPKSASVELTALILLIVLIAFVSRPIMLWVIKKTPKGRPVRRSFFQCIIFLALLSAFLSSFSGQSALVGPYLLGLAVPDGAPLATTLVERVECLVSDVFMPILVATCALRADLSNMSATFDSSFTRLNIILLCIVSIVKLITCLLSALLCNLHFRESLTLSLIISCKGAVELVLYTMVIDGKGISERLFSLIVLIILAVATFVPMAVRFLYDPQRKYGGQQKRNIKDLNPNSELRVLACIHRDDNVYSIVHLLNLSCPTKDSPLAIFVFHLIEFIGRTTPIFISHRKSKMKMLNFESYSQNIILSVEHFERESNGTVQAECFTAISPNKVMHDDICTLALDKATSLIILPFHRTWTAAGTGEDDNGVRSLNCSVLERAPCSIGIFINRGNLGPRTAEMATTTASLRNTFKYSVCMIYLGGDDDREALSYAKRMANDTRVELTVMRIRAQEEEGGSSNWDSMLDLEVLRHFKLKFAGQGVATYREEVCENGPQTAARIRKMVNSYDLMIIGRRHGSETRQLSSLSEWNEFPELGVLGDLIASADNNCTTSLLVIQLQILS